MTTLFNIIVILMPIVIICMLVYLIWLVRKMHKLKLDNIPKHLDMEGDKDEEDDDDWETFKKEGGENW